jgi:hypothetical protein
VRFVLLLIAQIEQGRELWIGNGHHIAPLAAIATIRPAAGHKFLAAKANTPPPAIAGNHADLYFVDKFHIESVILTVNFRLLTSDLCFPLPIIPFSQAKKKPREGLFFRARSFFIELAI